MARVPIVETLELNARIPHSRKRKRETAATRTESLHEAASAEPVVTASIVSRPNDPPFTVPAGSLSHVQSNHESQHKQPSSYLGRSDYITSHIPIDEADATQYQAPTHQPRSVVQQEMTRLQNLPVLELPRSAVRQSLVRNFLARCRPWMPLLSVEDVHAQELHEPASLLMNCIFVAGSRVSTAPQAAEIGQRCYERAKLSLFSDSLDQPLRAIIAAIFLQWWNPSGPEHVSMDNSSFWLRISVALAHQIGLHRQPAPDFPHASLCRKVWWTLVSRDSQIATSHGRPRAIDLRDSNVRPLGSADFEKGLDDDALLFSQFIRITTVLGDLTEHYRRGTLGEHNRMGIEAALLRWIKDMPPVLRLHNRETGSLNAYNFQSRQLHVPYFVALLILFRQKTPEQPPTPVSLLAASFVSGIFEEFLMWEDISYLAPTFIFYLLVGSLVQISSHCFPAMATAAVDETKTITLSINELKTKFPTALGAERVIENVMKRSIPGSASSQHVELSLPRDQFEFFSPFGPDLCRQWSIVFNDRPHSLATAQALPPDTATEMTNILPTSPNITQGDVMPFGTDNEPWTEAGRGWQQSINAPKTGETDLAFDEPYSDTVGHWWWSNWVTQQE